MSVEQAYFPIGWSAKHSLRFIMAKGVPFEVGGVIMPDGLVRAYPNLTKDDPTHIFEMDVTEEHRGAAAFWHSHPAGPAHISHHDITCMVEMHKLGLAQPWVVVSPHTITAWRVNEQA